MEITRLSLQRLREAFEKGNMTAVLRRVDGRSARTENGMNNHSMDRSAPGAEKSLL